TDEIYARLAALVKQPIRPIRRENMEKVLKYFEERCVQSRQLSERAERVIPGGVQHNLAFNYPFPLAITGANGAYLTDVDGNRYIDFLKAGGPTLLPSNDATVRQQVHALLDSCGAITGLLHEYEVKLAELVCEAMPAVEMFRMLGSGTEAVMAALRLARAYTGRKWVIKIGGAYHGWSDQMVYGMRIPGTGRREAIGIPRPSTAYIQESFPNDLAALRRTLWLNRFRGGTAAIIVEPLGPESGMRPVHRDFNRRLRELCNEFGVLLIFDEVVTGFRIGMGRARLFRSEAGHYRAGKMPDRRLPHGRSRWRTARRDDAAGWRNRGNLEARICGRNPVGKPTLLCGRLFRDSRDEAHERRGEGRACRRSFAERAQRNYRPAGPTVRHIQPRFNCSPANLRRAAHEYAKSPQTDERTRAAQAHDGRNGGGVQCPRNRHSRGQPHVHRTCRYRC